jgi:DNA-3-methyladenine glycosylase
MNVVTGPAGTPSAVLLRAGEVIEGVDLARTRRGISKDRDLARGPARLCVALGINRDQNAVDLLAKASPVRLLDGPGFDGTPSTGPRVGLREAPDWPWRFWIPDDPTVSPYRPHVPKRRTSG